MSLLEESNPETESFSHGGTKYRRSKETYPTLDKSINLIKSSVFFLKFCNAYMTFEVNKDTETIFTIMS